MLEFIHLLIRNKKFDNFKFLQIFNVQTLDLKAVGQSFGFVTPPHIDFGVGVSKQLARAGRKNKEQDHKKTKIFRQGKPKGMVQFAR